MSEESQILLASGSGIQTIAQQLAVASPQIVYLVFDGAKTSYNSKLLTIDNIVIENSGYNSKTIMCVNKSIANNLCAT